MEQLRKEYRESKESTLLQDMTILKKKLSDAESQLRKESIEKQEIIVERDQFQLAARKLVSLFYNYVARLYKHPLLTHNL